jgi:hypothetical protein
MPARGQEAMFFEEVGFVGVNMIDAETDMPRGHLRNCVNLLIDPSGGLMLRRGIADIGTALTGSGTIAIRGHGRWRPSSGTAKRVAAYYDAGDSAVHLASSTGGAWTAITIPTATGNYTAITLNTTASIQMLMAGELLILLNGVNRITCWDGTNDLNYFGVLAPTGSLTVSLGSGSTPGGATPPFKYWYLFAYENPTYSFVSSCSPNVGSLGKGEAVDPTHAITVGIPADAALDPGVTKVKIYRSFTATAQQPSWSSFYYLDTKTSYTGAGVNYTDTTTDAVLITHATFLSEFGSGIYDHDLPPTGASRACVHKSRLFALTTTAADASNVFYSKVNEKAYFPAGNDFEADAGVGSGLKQLAPMENGILLMKEDGSHILETYGAPEQWRIRKISVRGCWAPDTLRMVQDYTGRMGAVRLAKDGVAFANEEGDILISDSIWPMLKDVPSDELADFTAFYLPKDGFYVLNSPNFSVLTSVIPGGSGLIQAPGSGTSVGIGEDETSGTEGQALIAVQRYFFNLKKPIQSNAGEPLGLACTFGTKGFKHILDETTEDDEDIYGVGQNTTKIMKIWTGYTDMGVTEAEEIPGNFTLRPLAPESKFAERRYRIGYLRMMTASLYFDCNFILDFGVQAKTYTDLSALVADTILGVNIFKKPAAPTFLDNSGSGTLAGYYYYFYVLADTTNLATCGMMTQPSAISAAMSAGAGPDNIRMTLPGDQTAYLKGYRYYHVWRYAAGVSAGSTPAYSSFLTEFATAVLDSGGADVILNDTGSLTPPDQVFAAWEPPDEIEWASAGLKNIHIPLSARMVGTFLTPTIYFSSSDPFLKFMAFGLLYKQRMPSK